MKAKKIWIATHPDESDNFEVSITEPNSSDTVIYPYMDTHNPECVEYKEFILIEVEQ